MFKRIFSLVIIVLISGTMASGVEAAIKKHTKKAAPKAAVAQTIKVCSKEDAKKVKWPQKARIVTCSKKKVAQRSSKKKTHVATVAKKPQAAKSEMAEKPSAKRTKRIKDLSEKERMTLCVLGEARMESPLGWELVASVIRNYAKLQNRSIIAELNSRNRYVAPLCHPRKRHQKLVNEMMASVAWAPAFRIVEKVLQYQKPSDNRFTCATTYQNRDGKGATVDGVGWIDRHATRLGRIGNHEFGIEDPETKLEKVGRKLVPLPNHRPFIPLECDPGGVILAAIVNPKKQVDEKVVTIEPAASAPFPQVKMVKSKPTPSPPTPLRKKPRPTQLVAGESVKSPVSKID